MNNSEYSFSAFIGIDVAKNKIDIFEQKSQTVRTVGSNKQEINSRIKTPTDTEQTMVIMEATGGYESLLVDLLHQHNIALAVVNPRQVRDFAKGVGCDAKTPPSLMAFPTPPGMQVLEADQPASKEHGTRYRLRCRFRACTSRR